ncbi:hypothetical protein [Micromonospora halophytica]|uniref:Uncharacterized protein n=1 Tax=Micromonospora halophytica TaxID=47864 RepID=A0A1C5H1C4_9ACTN|nr:hypothetical protein [Micromonospora halophytica]SCG39879.1 hypothetical protein GA0070560_102473 [Micromonospora halophytica]
MAARSRRQAGLTALCLGVFATIWFSVPAADPPLRTLLVVASGAALLTALGGAAVVLRAGRAAAAMPRDRRADRRYGLIVAVEFAAAALGAVLLSVAGRVEFVPVLVCGVVGVHFVPLAPVLRDRLLVPLAVAMCLVALAGLVVGLTSSASAGLVVGTGAGLVLWGYALLALLRAARVADR